MTLPTFVRVMFNSALVLTCISICIPQKLFSQAEQEYLNNGEECLNGVNEYYLTNDKQFFKPASDGYNISLIGRWANGPCQAVDVESNVLCFSRGGLIEIADIADPEQPVILAEFLVNGEIRDLDISGDFIYAGMRPGGLVIVDISTPSSPVERGRFSENSSFWEVKVSGDYVYAADYLFGLRVIDVSDPDNPFVAAERETTGTNQGVSVSEQYVYLAAGSGGIYTYDITDPTNPVEVSHYDPSYFKSHDICVSGDYAYIAECWYGFVILDVSDPSNPIQVFTNDYRISDLEVGSHGWEVAVHGNLAFLYDKYFEHDLFILDISNPLNPFVLSGLTTGDPRYKICYADDHLYTTAGANGLLIFDVSNLQEPIERFRFAAAGFSEDVEVSGDYVYVANGYGGFRIIDISDIDNPVETGRVDLGNVDELSVSGNLACAVDNDNSISTEGLNFIDVSDPSNPVFKSNFRIINTCFDVVLYGDYVYGAFGECFLILNITDQELPVTLSRIDETDTWFNSVKISGSYAYLTYYQPFGDENTRGLRIYDVSKPENPVVVSDFTMNSDPHGVAVSNSSVYVCCDSGVVILDVSTPSIPVETGMINMMHPRDIHISSRYAYITNSSEGLKIFDISSPGDPVEKGYYKTGDYAIRISVDDNRIYVADYSDGVYILQNDIVETEMNGNIAGDFRLYNNYPNPFNPETTIRIKLLKDADVSLKIYDITGRQVRNLTSGMYPAGDHYIRWDAKNDRGQKVGSGVYIYRLKAGNITKANKMLLVK